ncbi:MAG: sigma-70 family RNA polymerase sigma factor, partial [Lysobacterales bacterium]
EPATVPAATHAVTRLLRTWREGNEQAREELLPMVYQELRRLAQRELRRERPAHTLESRDLVHEAYMRLVGAEVYWQDRSHFFALCGRTMRRILVDHARARRRDKRGSGITLLPLDEADGAAQAFNPDVLLLDEALSRLGGIDARMEQVVELHFFGGLTYDELAQALAISTATVHRDLAFAKAWLRRQLSDA